MRKMFSQNQIINLIQKGINSGEVIIPQELPATAEASAGQILALDSDKEPVWDDVVDLIAGEDIAPKDISATGNITGASIIENMSGYSMAIASQSADLIDPIYWGICKNGNKLTIVCFQSFTKGSDFSEANPDVLRITIPEEIGEKLYPFNLGANNILAEVKVPLYSGADASVDKNFRLRKTSNTSLFVDMRGATGLTTDTTYYGRLEFTLLLSDNLIPQGE